MSAATAMVRPAGRQNARMPKTIATGNNPSSAATRAMTAYGLIGAWFGDGVGRLGQVDGHRPPIRV
ncbi:hypothetical protein [Rhodococcus sp. NPDC057529]|uniref:hypothetical protein n=1 Tax=Rhodococcus sp. NPDC057529 TaxID=3346158 RepID=UPI00366CDFFC